ncbi:P-loop NTPase family protein [Vibrio harveyi]
MDIRKKLHSGDLTPHIDPIPVPTSCDALGVPEAVVENLVLKHLAAYPKSDLLELSKLLGVVIGVVETVLATLRARSEIEVFQPSEHGFQASISHNHIRYSLSEKGRKAAEIAFVKDPYLGPVPVSLAHYCEIVEAQDLRSKAISRQALETALSDVYGADRLVPLLGPAINSGRAMLLYGEAGTGKTFVASKIINALNTSVYIPFAVYALGNVIKVFSPQHHVKVEGHFEEAEFLYKKQYDNRWVLCERPNIQVGGELTLDMLEVNHSEHNRVWLAPLQMMANNGILVIDDLGRQPVPVDALLNRWIVPMEYFFDQFSLPNGQQITAPFILNLAFSTNFTPEKISDPAFLRRLGYKIKFDPILKDEYQELWLKTAKQKALGLESDALDTVINLHQKNKVAFYPCLPKDLVGISQDMIKFEEYSPIITSEILERAWKVYFTED